KGANFACAFLKGADLSGANLEKTNGTEATFEGANFEGANLCMADFSDSILSGANFKNANLTDASLYYSHVKNSNFEGANLNEAILEAANFEGANLYKANFEGAILARDEKQSKEKRLELEERAKFVLPVKEQGFEEQKEKNDKLIESLIETFSKEETSFLTKENISEKVYEEVNKYEIKNISSENVLKLINTKNFDFSLIEDPALFEIQEKTTKSFLGKYKLKEGQELNLKALEIRENDNIKVYYYPDEFLAKLDIYSSLEKIHQELAFQKVALEEEKAELVQEEIMEQRDMKLQHSDKFSALEAKNETRVFCKGLKGKIDIYENIEVFNQDLRNSYDSLSNHPDEYELSSKIMKSKCFDFYKDIGAIEGDTAMIKLLKENPEISEKYYDQIAKVIGVKEQSKEQKTELQQEKKPMERTYLSVPYPEKNQAKALGARWDKKNKSWYVKAGIDTKPFKTWLPKPEVKQEPQKTVSKLSPQEEFENFLKDNGFKLKGSPVMDGEWHRVEVEGDKKGKKNGSYLGFLDGQPNGQINNFKTGEKDKWVHLGQSLTPEQKAELRKDFEKIKETRKVERQAKYKLVAKKAFGVFTNLEKTASKENCSYLAKKDVHGYGVKINKQGDLVIPLKNSTGFLWGIQTVSEDKKMFLENSKKAGCMHVIDNGAEGKLNKVQSNKIYVAEGYSTAATIHELTNTPVVAAFDASNLKEVSAEIRKALPKAEIIIVADNDHKLKNNVGIEKANEAAKEIGAKVI
ncbi:MAG: pentapeptide repeat-containing protein, partial [Alphaproteobacteria bacterium]|nr:pentapeptide repeat-containing protein [Alphaproteobacteria bacterium]